MATDKNYAQKERGIQPIGIKSFFEFGSNVYIKSTTITSQTCPPFLDQNIESRTRAEARQR
jgi:hypothetical protein